MRRQIAFAFLAVLAFATIAQAGATVTDIEHLSDAGGVWRNSTTAPHAGGNWAIWAADASDPSTYAPGTFLNDGGLLAPGPPELHEPAGSFALAEGVHTYLLYKNTYNTTHASTKFTLSNGFGSGTLTVNGLNLPYLSTAAPAPSVVVVPLVLGNTTIGISNFAWYTPAVYNKSFVGDENKFGDIGGPDDIAVVTFQVTTVPEPASLVMFGLGAVGLVAIARRRRTLR